MTFFQNGDKQYTIVLKYLSSCVKWQFYSPLWPTLCEQWLWHWDSGAEIPETTEKRTILFLLLAKIMWSIIRVWWSHFWCWSSGTEPQTSWSYKRTCHWISLVLKLWHWTSEILFIPAEPVTEYLWCWSSGTEPQKSCSYKKNLSLNIWYWTSGTETQKSCSYKQDLALYFSKCWLWCRTLALNLRILAHSGHNQMLLCVLMPG